MLKGSGRRAPARLPPSPSGGEDSAFWLLG
jgi:hypothetical protein